MGLTCSLYLKFKEFSKNVIENNSIVIIQMKPFQSEISNHNRTTHLLFVVFLFPLNLIKTCEFNSGNFANTNQIRITIENLQSPDFV